MKKENFEIVVYRVCEKGKQLEVNVVYLESLSCFLIGKIQVLFGRYVS